MHAEALLSYKSQVLPSSSFLIVLQVGLETTCVVICTLMLASIFKTGQNYMSEEEEAEFMDKCRNYALTYR
jgi:hypothetical protein